MNRSRQRLSAMKIRGREGIHAKWSTNSNNTVPVSSTSVRSCSWAVLAATIGEANVIVCGQSHQVVILVATKCLNQRAKLKS